MLLMEERRDAAVLLSRDRPIRWPHNLRYPTQSRTDEMVSSAIPSFASINIPLFSLLPTKIVAAYPPIPLAYQYQNSIKAAKVAPRYLHHEKHYILHTLPADHSYAILIITSTMVLPCDADYDNLEATWVHQSTSPASYLFTGTNEVCNVYHNSDSDYAPLEDEQEPITEDDEPASPQFRAKDIDAVMHHTMAFSNEVQSLDDALYESTALLPPLDLERFQRRHNSLVRALQEFADEALKALEADRLARSAALEIGMRDELRSFIQDLEPVKKDDIQENCPICPESLGGSQSGTLTWCKVARLPCHENHIMHSGCAQSWLCKSPTCPLDRMEMFASRTRESPELHQSNAATEVLEYLKSLLYMYKF